VLERDWSVTRQTHSVRAGVDPGERALDLVERLASEVHVERVHRTTQVGRVLVRAGHHHGSAPRECRRMDLGLRQKLRPNGVGVQGGERRANRALGVLRHRQRCSHAKPPSAASYRILSRFL
jgi:hypothetical protein